MPQCSQNQGAVWLTRGWCGYSNTIYMVPNVALVTVDGLISIFNRSLAGATGIDRGTSLSWARVWVDVTRSRNYVTEPEVWEDWFEFGWKSNFGLTYLCLILRLDLDVLWHVPVMVANRNNTVARCDSPTRYACLERENKILISFYSIGSSCSVFRIV